MDYKSFLSEVQAEILYYLPESYKDSKVTINPIQKNNGLVLDGLSILKSGQEISPTIYLNQFYRDLEDGGDFEDILGDIAALRVEHDQAPENISKLINNTNSMKDKIYYTIVGYDSNKERLQNIPHKVVNDMAFTYRLSVENIGDSVTSAVISNDLMKNLNLDLDTLHKLAIENTPKLFPAEFMTMNDIIKSMMGVEEWEDMNSLFDVSEGPQLYILTNINKMNGAGVLFYPGQMDDIKKQLNRDFYVLPSSIHEVIIVPKTEEITSYNELQDMVQEVNITGVSQDEILTGNVYFYDGHELYLASEYENTHEINHTDFLNRMMKDNSYDSDFEPGLDM